MQCKTLLYNISVLNYQHFKCWWQQPWRPWLHIVIQHFCSQAPTSASLALSIGHLRHHINGISISEFFIIVQPTFMSTENPTTRTNKNVCICASYFCICTFYVSTYFCICTIYVCICASFTTFAFACSTFTFFRREPTRMNVMCRKCKIPRCFEIQII